MRTDWKKSLRAGAKLIQKLFIHSGKHGSPSLSMAMVGYNWGIGNLWNLQKGKKSSVPIETMKYVDSVAWAYGEGGPGDNPLAELVKDQGLRVA